MNHILHHKFTKVIVLLCVIQLPFGTVTFADPTDMQISMSPIVFKIEITKLDLVRKDENGDYISPQVIATVYATNPTRNSVFFPDNPSNSIRAEIFSNPDLLPAVENGTMCEVRKVTDELDRSGHCNPPELPCPSPQDPTPNHRMNLWSPAGSNKAVYNLYCPLPYMKSIPPQVTAGMHKISMRLSAESLSVYGASEGISHIQPFFAEASQIVFVQQPDSYNIDHILRIVESNHNYLSTLVTSGITGMPQALEELKRLILGVPVKVKMALQSVFDRILRMLREILRRLPPLRRT